MRLLRRLAIALALLCCLCCAVPEEATEACEATPGGCVAAEGDESAQLQLKAAAGAARASWKYVDTKNTYPHERDEAGAYVWKEKKLCLLGGRGTQPVDCFNANGNNKWVRSSSVTYNVHHVQPVVYQGKVYIVAGWTGDWGAEKDIEKVLIYDSAKDTIKEGCDIPKKFRTGAAGVVKYKKAIYIISGASGGHQKALGAFSTPNFTKFKPDNCKWTEMPAKPQFNRDHFQAVVVGSKLVLAGGRDSPRSTDPSKAISFQTKETEIYDFEDGDQAVWKKKRNLPLPRGGNTAVAWNNSVYVLGGETDQNPTSPQCSPELPWRAHKEVSRYDLDTNAWTDLPKMNTGRHAHGSAVLEDPDGKLNLWSAAGVKCAGGYPTVVDTERLALE